MCRVFLSLIFIMLMQSGSQSPYFRKWVKASNIQHVIFSKIRSNFLFYLPLSHTGYIAMVPVDLIININM